MARDIILVGAGAYFKDLAGPSIRKMKEQGLVRRFITVDTHLIEGNDAHVLRGDGVPLSDLVDNLCQGERVNGMPLVILAHPNQLHTPEAIDLLQNTQCKPDVLIEKPYAITGDQMETLKEAFETYKGRVGTLEYYLTMKGVPLLLAGGLVKPESFFFSEPVLKLRSERTLDSIAGSLAETVGKPLFVVSEVLEGEGSYGTIAHRNSSIVDARQGGGMIQDLVHHALSPLLALKGYLGDITYFDDVRSAVCDSYEHFGMEQFGIPREHIGESYAEMDITTDAGVPVSVAVGKYVENGTNQRRIVINGTRGVMIYDMTNNVLSLQRGDDVTKTIPLLEADKKGAPKYYPVIRAAVDTMNGDNPFTFDPFAIAMQAQGLVFKALQTRDDYALSSLRTPYQAGTMHDKIFDY